MKKGVIALLVLMSLVLLAACAPAPAPAVAPKEAPPTTSLPTQPVAAEETWKATWEKMVEEGKREGRVVIISSMGPEVKRELTRGFREKFGIQVEFLTMRGGELAVKLEAERRAGLYLMDILIGGSTTLTTVLQPAGYLEPIEPQLILPEVRDPKVWWAGKLPLAGYGYGISVMKFVWGEQAINTEKVKVGEIKSYRDLLNPKWKGRIVMDDPTVSGSGLKWASYILWTKTAGGEEFLRSLVNQEPVINRDRRLVAEWLARGKYDIAIAVRAEMMKPFIEMGAPVKWFTVQEGAYVSSGGGIASLIKNAPHPNAAKLFLNWVLTREAVLLWSKAVDQQSARVDVPTDFLDPYSVRKAGVEYFDSDEEEFVKRGEAAETLKVIFATVLK